MFHRLVVVTDIAFMMTLTFYTKWIEVHISIGCIRGPLMLVPITS